MDTGSIESKVSNTTHRSHWLGWLADPRCVVILAPFVLLAPVWLTGKALFWGVVSLQFIPWRVAAWDILRSGHLPLWNPWNGMGAPLLANYQSALLYPPNWLTFLLHALGGTGWAAWGQALLVAAHLAWAGLGMLLLARRLGVGTLGQSIGGLAFSLSGFLVTRAGFLSINAAVAWLPWVILGVEMLDIRQRWTLKQSGILIISLTFLFLAGHAQTAWYTLLLAAMWAVYRGWQSGKLRGLWLMCLLLALAGLLAAGLAAPQLLPTMEYLLQSQRASQVDFELAMTYSFWPWRFVTLLAPDMFGNPRQGDFWGYANYWEDAVYIGLLPLLAAGAAVFKLKMKALPLLILAAAAFLLALGKNTPVFPWLYRNVPSFSMFQAPTRYSIWAVFALTLLAAFGVEVLRRPVGRALYWTRLATAGAFAIMLGCGLVWIYLSDVSPTFIRATALMGFWGLGAGVLTLTAPPAENESTPYSARKLAIWSWAVVGWVAADLMMAGWGMNLGIEQSFYAVSSSNSTVSAMRAEQSRIYLPTDVEEELKFNRFMRFDTFQPDADWSELRVTVLPNLNLLDGLASVNNFDPLVPGRFAHWMDRLDEMDPAQKDKLVNLMAVGAVGRMDLTMGTPFQFQPLSPGARIRWAPCGIAVQGAEKAWQMVASGTVNFDQNVVLESESENSASDCPDSQPVPEFSLVSENPNRLEIRIDTSESGWLVISDTWYPGWRASVDGADVPVVRANYLFRAVPVSAGEHQVVFSYQPASFYAGLVLLLLVASILVISWRRGSG